MAPRKANAKKRPRAFGGGAGIEAGPGTRDHEARHFPAQKHHTIDEDSGGRAGGG